MNEPVLNQLCDKFVPVITFDALKKEVFPRLFFSGSVLIYEPFDISDAAHHDLLNFDTVHAPIGIG